MTRHLQQMLALAPGYEVFTEDPGRDFARSYLWRAGVLAKRRTPRVVGRLVGKTPNHGPLQSLLELACLLTRRMRA